jgi:hypothetical protein
MFKVFRQFPTLKVLLLHTQYIGASSDTRMQRTFKVKPNHSRKVVVTRWFQKKECKVSNVKISFPRDAKIKCKFHDNRKNKEKTLQFLIKDILKSKENTDKLTVMLEGKYVWMETKLIMKVEDPLPL